MAKAKTSRARAMNPAPLNTAAKSLKVSVDAAKYTGYEPVWEGVEITADNRKHHLSTGLNWYNYNFGSKDAHAFLQEYLTINERKDEAKQLKRAHDNSVSNALGWLSRMTMMGWVLDEDETNRIDTAIEKAIASVAAKKAEVDPESDEAKEAKATKAKFNIQERMREIAAEAEGEIEGLLDDYIKAGAKASHNFKPIDVLKIANILPAHAGAGIAHWEAVAAEYKEAHAGEDADLKEGYSQFTKIQLRNLVKFAEMVVADYHSYVAYKKSTKKVRARKVKTPDQLARKLKFMPKEDTLKLVSEKPAKIIGAKEMFAYDAKKRKLMYFIADEYAGGLSIKNNTIEGFNTTKSVQKTVRKPAEQLKALMAASRPNTRKLFEKTKSVETKMSGRFNDNIVILKVF